MTAGRRALAAGAGAAVALAALFLAPGRPALPHGGEGAVPAPDALARLGTGSSPGTDTARAPFQRPPPPLLERRREALMDSVGAGAAVVPSARPQDLETDYPQASDFRQNNDFLYLTGLETPRSWLVLVIRPGGGRMAILFVPEPDPSEARWTGEQPSLEEAGRLSGIADVRPASEFERLVDSGSLATFVGGGALYLPFRAQAPSDPLLDRLAWRSGLPVRDLKPALDALRLVKDSFEIRMLRAAVEITGDGLRAAMAAARPGMYEYELEAAVEGRFRAGGAERVGFPSIVGSGPNSVVLHYDESRRRMGDGDLVVTDVGAEYSYYTADVSRTIPVSGRFTDRQRRLYELVLGALEAGLEAVRPGATVRDVSAAARGHLRRHSGGLCGEEGCEKRFVHGVGHWLGMDVHDVGDYSTPFRAGMVLTVEPGVYLPDDDLGIRIEEDVLVTGDGREVLSRGIPRSVEEIEAAMARESAAVPVR